MKISISIPAPCHEPWKDMSPRPQGRHCTQCDHVVADLTRATDAELVALFTSDARPKCARFDPAQLDRALGAAEQRYAHALPVAAFSSLLALASGQEALAQQGAPMPKVGEVSISAPAPTAPRLMGKMIAVPHSIPLIIDSPHVTGDTVVVPMDVPLEVSEPRITCVIPPEEMPALDPAQLDRALGTAEQRASSALPIAAFSSLLALASGQEALAQQGAPMSKVGEVSISVPAPPPPQVMGKMMAVPHSIPPTSDSTHITGDTVVVPVDVPLKVGEPRINCVIPPEEVPALDPPSMLEVCGKVVDEATGEALPFVAVGVQNTPLGVTTDMDGNFTLKVPQRAPDEVPVLELRDVGYEDRTYEVVLTGGLPDDVDVSIDHTTIPVSAAADPKDPRGVQGRLLDPITGTPMADVIIGVKGSAVRVRCDANGNYFLHVPEALGDGPFSVEFVRPGFAPQEVMLSMNGLPACIARDFISVPPPPAPAKAGGTCQALGTITMAPDKRAITVSYGMMVVRRFEEPPTAVQRITGPMIRTWRRLVH